ncbi:arginine deiminase-related protein [soil metagenome]
MQNCNHLLMIQPVNFGFNQETAANNTFQRNTKENVQQQALKEFNDFVALLRVNNVDVTVIPDTTEPFTPDSIFPNNWVSFHADGTVFLYPMFAENRRQERKPHILKSLQEKFSISTMIDLSHHEKEGLFLEGTGSMILDRENKILYACISPRTSLALLKEFCALTGYAAVSFYSKDMNTVDIYHTNVMMSVADKFAVVCLESIADKKEREKVINSLQLTHKEIIEISLPQLNAFAGNMLQIRNIENELLSIMSTQAYNSLAAEQRTQLEKYNRILHSPLYTIEQAGGGSARCMMAEVFNKQKLK